MPPRALNDFQGLGDAPRLAETILGLLPEGIAVLIRSASDAADGGWSFSVLPRMAPAVASVLDMSGVLSRLSIAEAR